MLSTKFESIHIDLKNNIYKINGQDMDEGTFYLKIEFGDGGWMVEQSSDKFYFEQKAGIKDKSLYKKTKKIP